MPTKIKHILLIILGWLFIILGVIGAVLPILPTTPFLILALACFAESSPRFHRMLLNNKWFGPALAQWERTKTIRRNIKYKVMLLIIATFGISIFVLSGRTGLQLMLVVFCLMVLFFVWRIKESDI
ncbi:MAG: YbaN family protein [Pseudomonadota bacterium]|nr:YbaN family protein [Pseudomonadota bacterium]MDO7667500.1 YbaN family protein [Pseudomonadota bacterium]MDO7710837.1 YbaN family protein [Pseudomonadota bacterium]